VLFLVVIVTAACSQTPKTRVALTRAEAPPTTALPLLSPPVTEPLPQPVPTPVQSDDDGADEVDYRAPAPRRCEGGGVQPGPFLVAEAIGQAIPVFHAPGEEAPYTSLSNPNGLGSTRVLLVAAQQGDWLNVLLPVRPNGSAGWVRTADVKLAQHNFRIHVQQGAHMITAWNGAEVIAQEPIGLGRAGTSTPCGEYYITDLLRPTNPGGAYGPYAFGLSGFSEVLYRFAGGNGQIGLHGTNQPSGLGRSVSHGCIRMSNEGITRLASVLPLGTPVFITA
jgi:lipoprotein-anchoring transpeptidase ErfK/SrfK